MTRRILPVTVTEIHAGETHCDDCGFVEAPACYPCCGLRCALFGVGLTDGEEHTTGKHVGPPLRSEECIAAEKAASEGERPSGRVATSLGKVGE